MGKFIKKHILFFVLILLVFVIQSFLLKPYLSFGFDDTADQYAAQFSLIRQNYPDLIQFIPKSIEEIPLLWVHEYYYMGFLNHFLGDNLVAYHHVAHFLKSLAAISTYPMFFVLSGSSLLAFISSLMFAISYSSGGSLDPVVVNGDYLGIIALSTFFAIYFSLIKKGSNSRFVTYLTGLIFLLLSLSIATTRTFPVAFMILAIEIFILLKNRSFINLKLISKRLAIFLLPIIFIVILKPSPVIERVTAISVNLDEYFFTQGMNELLLVPFLSFASTILPIRLWSYLPIVLFYILPIFLAFLLSKKPLKFLLITYTVVSLGLLVINWSWLSSSSHNFVELKTKTPMAFVTLGLAFSFLYEWLQNKNRLYIGLFLGPFLSFTFIFCIWILSQERGFFNDIHRYLTHSSIFMSLFIGSLLVVLYNRFKNIKLKIIAYFIFLLIPVYFIISLNQIKVFSDEKSKEGYTLKDQDIMRRQLIPYLEDAKSDRLIYIDLYSEKDRVYYKEIYRYGPIYWNFWYGKTVKKDAILYSVFDYNLLKQSVSTKDGIKGILFQGVFYQPFEFRAIKMQDKKAFDITDQVKKDLGL